MNNGQVPAFGATLRKLRLQAGYSQETLAERAGVSARAISDLERGVRANARLETIRMLAQGLGLDQEGFERLLVAHNGTNGIDQHSVILPVAQTSFIGREATLNHIIALFDDENVRLVTLTGTGGVGKTRIAIQVAQAVATRFQDGAVFVNLAPVTAVSDVIPTIASILNIPSQPNLRDIDVLTAALEQKRLLLILDNLEQVIGCATDIGRLLSACPQLMVLATSRVVLKLAAEHVVRIEPMRLPSDHDISSEAMRLFMARASASDSTFEPMFAEDAAIVQKLEGVPLSIELAASRVKYTSRLDLLNQLDAQLPVLVSRVVDLPSRHRSVRDTVSWSYHLLSSEAQRVMRWLSAFPAGCTPETAHQLFGQLAVLDPLEELMDSSLVRQRIGTDGVARYTMLQVILEYAFEQLQLSGEEDRVRSCIHTIWAMPLAKSAEYRIWYPDASEFFRMLDIEAPNLASHMRWLMESEHIEDAMLITRWLTAWSFNAGRQASVRRELECLLGHQAGPHSSPGRVAALTSLGIALFDLGEASASIGVFEQAAEMAEAIGDRIYLADALASQGKPLWQLGYLDAAEQRIREGIIVAEENEEQTLVAICIADLGRIAMEREQWDLARKYCEQSLERHYKSEALWGMARTNMTLAEIALALDEVDEAERRATSALAYFEQINSRPGLPVVYLLLAAIARHRDQNADALSWLTSALQIAQEMGDMRRMADVHLEMARLTASREHYQLAFHWYERCGNTKGMRQAQAGMQRIDTPT
ncbi:MAG: helix-turn-helix domain-containing protein [Thermomicrobiales bacterium]|nr:helix-turn-helix domain-containing protein [Thermomicrobiales bacterium]